jgi:hypothetical protein
MSGDEKTMSILGSVALAGLAAVLMSFASCQRAYNDAQAAVAQEAIRAGCTTLNGSSNLNVICKGDSK